MTTRTKLEILDSRHDRGMGLPIQPDSYSGINVDPNRRDMYAETLIGSGNYRDTGCDLAPACLSCPYSECVKELRRDASRMVRYASIWRDYKRMMANGDRPIASVLAKKYGVATRTIHRAVLAGKQGKLKGVRRKPKVDTHKFLTRNIFKQRKPWAALPVSY